MPQFQDMDKPIYFVSDHHFGEKPGEDEKVRKFIEFTEHIKGCEALFIAGDFFDFYFEYKTQIPKAHFNVLGALQTLRRSGTKIHYITGNHDFWIGDFFTKTLGIEVHKGPQELTLQGRRVFIGHGDEFTKFNPLRWVLRNRLNIFLFYWIHPDIAHTIGRLVSALSARKTRATVKWDELYVVGKQKFELGFDAVIFGHIHMPKHVHESTPTQSETTLSGNLPAASDTRGPVLGKGCTDTDRDFLLLGDWINHFSYAKLLHGRFSLLMWKQPSQPCSPSSTWRRQVFSLFHPHP
jgi:UDP-2,3-diacylglucosamine hydrolase